MSEVKKHRQTCNLSVRSLHPHPKNPRKDLGDLTELTESIKKNGIMQNLTVIPGYYDEDAFINDEKEYTVVIGHRRLEAAKAAGLTEVPCRIYENLPENDQIATMLEENMQRNDLTVYEQAQSFQLMLDLGETVDTLSEKTGFAKSTIYHRLNIAKLDQQTLKEREEEEGFQLMINDLIELEKIEDIKTRDRILKEARSSNDLRFRAQQAAKEEKLSKKEKQWREYLEGSLADEGEQSMKWSGRYEKIFEQDLREDKEFDPEEVEDLITDETYYVINYGYVTLLEEKTNEADDDDDDDEEESEWEKERKEKEACKRKYEAVRNPLKEETHDFVRAIVEEKLKNPDKEDIADITETLFKLFLEEYDSYSCALDDVIEFVDPDVDARDETTDEYKKAHDIALSLPIYKILLILLQGEVNDRDLRQQWDGTYREDNARFAQRFYYILERWDWNTQAEEMELLNGTADYYKKEDKDDE